MLIYQPPTPCFHNTFFHSSFKYPIISLEFFFKLVKKKKYGLEQELACCSPQAKSSLAHHYVNKILLKYTHSFIYLLTMATFVLQPQGGSNRAYLKLKTSIIWPFTENADKPLVQSYRLRRNGYIKGIRI